MSKLFGSLRNKLYVISGTGTAMVLAVTLYGFWALWGSVQSYESLLRHDQDRMHVLDEVLLLHQKQVHAWKNILLRGRDPQSQEKYWGEIAKSDAAIRKAATPHLASLLADGKEAQAKLLERFLKGSARMFEVYGQALAEYRQTNFSAEAADRVAKGIDRDPAEALEQLSQLLDQDFDAAGTATHDSAKRALQFVLVLLLLIVAAAFVLFSIIIRRSVLTPTRTLLDATDRFATGDFATPFAVQTGDEIGHIAERMNIARESLGGTIRGVSATALELARASAEMQKNGESSTTSARRQQSEIHQLATAITEMAATVQEVARNTERAAASAREADHQAAEGKHIVQSTIQAIGGLAKEVERAADVIGQLDQESAAIGKVLEVIRSIAEQTNLLALNAAIEAARAGESGRGFAVVADEVRTLASRTQKSTEEIRASIERLQSGARDAVGVMQQGRAQATTSVEQASRAGSALAAIAAAVARLSDVNIQIASAAEEQTKVAEEIHRNVTNVNDSATASAAAVEQLSNRSKEVAAFAENLRDSMQRFRS